MELYAYSKVGLLLLSLHVAVVGLVSPKLRAEDAFPPWKGAILHMESWEAIEAPGRSLGCDPDTSPGSCEDLLARSEEML